MNEPTPPPLPANLLSSPSAPSPEHLRQWTDAHRSLGKIRQAITLAKFDAWSTAACAALTLLFGFSSTASLLTGLALAIVSGIEFVALRRLRRLEPHAPRLLAFNQLAFAALLILYALYNRHLTSTGASALSITLRTDPTLAQFLGPIDDLSRRLSMIAYASLIPVALLFQGGMAIFYFRTARDLRAYLHQTAPWIIGVQKAASAAA